MREQINNGFERLGRAAGTSREIQDQGFFAHSAKCPAEGCHGRFPGAFEAHAFRDAFEQAGADSAGGFGGDVAFGDSGSAGGRDQPGLAGEANDGLLNGGLIVGNDFSRDYRKLLPLEDFRDRGSGEVGAFAAG
jgi:hypothetical protein